MQNCVAFACSQTQKVVINFDWTIFGGLLFPNNNNTNKVSPVSVFNLSIHKIP